MEPFEHLADDLIDALDAAASALARALEAAGAQQKVLANHRIADEGTVSRWLSGAQQLTHGSKLPGVEVMHQVVTVLKLTGPLADELLALGRRVDSLRDRMRAVERSWRSRASRHYTTRTQPPPTAAPPDPPGRDREDDRQDPWDWRKTRFLAMAAAVIAVSGAIWFLWPPPDQGKVQSAAPIAAQAPPQPPSAGPIQAATPVDAAPEVTKGYGLRLVTERMAVRLPSRSWTQEAAGDIEIWSHKTCPPGVTAYWIALRPLGATVQFACDSWQHHKWTNVAAGTHNLDSWKNADGLAIAGVTILRSTVPIVEVPRKR
ncbi:hypothetical protein [Nonomuraea sp. NPDC046570]|uniref:hypothetical protein n=1 Tax=Nonomuraea sp. NPDC046570 TaxID=3155255 RepID=UPI0033FBF61D